jgi:hypothetical protein
LVIPYILNFDVFKAYKEFSMAQTIQPCSLTFLNKEDKGLTVNKQETEDNMSLLLQVFESLNTLCDKLNRLAYVLQRENMEQNSITKISR